MAEDLVRFSDMSCVAAGAGGGCGGEEGRGGVFLSGIPTMVGSNFSIETSVRCTRKLRPNGLPRFSICSAGAHCVQIRLFC